MEQGKSQIHNNVRNLIRSRDIASLLEFHIIDHQDDLCRRFVWRWYGAREQDKAMCISKTVQAANVLVQAISLNR